MFNDTDESYTKNWDRKLLKKHFYDIESSDKENFEICKKNNILYLNTFDNRENFF